MTDSPELSSVDGGGLIDPSFQPFPYSALQGSIVDRFDKIAQRYSARAAVSDRTRQITYAELAGLVDRIAAAITQALAGREGPVAILLAKDAYYPPAMLGVLAAGRGFVPLDISHPAAQNALIATQSGAAAVLSSRDLIAGIGKQFPPGLPFLDIESMNAGAVERSLAPGPDDLACIIYTSGSTGVPKGVHHTHRTLLHSVMRRTNSLRVTHHDKVALFAPPNVVTGTRVMMTAILNGASLHVLPPQDLKPSGLVREIRARDITNFSAAPTLLRQIAEVVGPHRRLDSVAVVGLGGERIDWGDFDVFRSLCSPDALLHTGIGSTESGGHYCDWFVDEAMKATSLRMPVGRAAPDMAVTLVDEDGRPVVDGESGEVLVASRYVGLGYWRNPELTAQVFGADPAHPGARFLKTGDWARRRPDGLFEFVGRRDGQIKLRGHRIELDEVEFMLGKCDGVEDGAVVVRRDELGQPRSMAAYVEPRKDNERPRPGDLRSMLAQRLPQYMIPATVVVLDELPRLANLKLDRVQLAQIDAARVSAASPPVNDPIVTEVTAIFETVIGNVKATPDDNISSLGGDSLQSIKIACELESRFKIAIPVDVFESAQTIQELAGWLAGQSVSR